MPLGNVILRHLLSFSYDTCGTNTHYLFILFCIRNILRVGVLYYLYFQAPASVGNKVRFGY